MSKAAWIEINRTGTFLDLHSPPFLLLSSKQQLGKIYPHYISYNFEEASFTNPVIPETYSSHTAHTKLRYAISAKSTVCIKIALNS